MKYVLFILLFANLSFGASEFTKPLESSVKSTAEIQDQAVVANEEIDFHEWESEFNTSMDKARKKVKKCEAKSKNCQFEKFQALDPSFDMVH